MIVEPPAALAAPHWLVLCNPFLSYALSFVAGAMLYVVVEEMIPEAARKGHIDRATLGFIVGFIVVTFDNALRWSAAHARRSAQGHRRSIYYPPR